MGSLYRSRLDGKSIDYVARFSSSLSEDKRIFEIDIDGTEVHDIMLKEQGIIQREDLTRILEALEKLRREWREGKIRLEGEYEDVHEFIEAYVIDVTGKEVGGKLHTARSRNDQVATDIRMQLREDLNSISDSVIELVDILLKRAEKNLQIPLLLYTHTQHAQIGTVGHYFLAYAEALLRDFHRLQDCYDRVNLSPLGAGPVGGTSLDINRDRTAMLLGFDGLVKNSLDATSSRDFMLEAAACLATLMTQVSRIVEDLILWSSSEFGFIELSDEFASVSSIMPQKKNPTALELIRGKTARVIGNLTGLLTMVKGLLSGYSSDLQETKPLLWDSCDQTNDSLKVLVGTIESMKLKPIKITQIASKNYVFAVDLAENLAVNGILSFREAHQVIGNLIKNMVERNLESKDLSTKLVEEAADKILGRKIKVNPIMVDEVKNPIQSIFAKKSLGSPNPSQCKSMLRELQEEIIVAKAALLNRKEKNSTYKKLLEKTIKEYLS